MLKLLGNLPIRTKLVLGSIISPVLITAFVLIYYPGEERQRIYGTVQKMDHAIAEVIAVGVGTGLGSGSFDIVLEALEWVKSDSSVAYVAVLDESNELLASYNPAEPDLDIAYLLNHEDIVKYGSNGEMIHAVRAPCLYEGERLGTLLYGTRLAQIKESLAASIRRTVLIGLAVLFLGIVVALACGHMITRPLLRLTGAARRMARGDLEVPLSINSGDEIGTLKTAFEDMATNLSHAMCLLKKSEKKYRSLFETAASLIIAVDDQGAISDCNSRITELLEYERDDIVGQPISRLLHPEDLTDFGGVVVRARERGFWYGHECRFVCKGGSFIHVNVNASALHNSPGKFAGVMFIAEDITDRRRTEAQLIQAKRLETAGQVAGQVAHDFNNLLGPLIGYPELMRLHLDPHSPVVRMLESMEQNAMRMAEINQQLLTLSRRGHYRVEPLNANDVVEHTLQAMTFPTTVTVHRSLSEKALSFLGGEAQIQRVLMNLLSNSVDALNGTGNIIVQTDRVCLDRPLAHHALISQGEYVRLRVSDDGPGIPADILDRVFDPFFTTKKTDSQRGSGLGLSIVHSVVEDHNGYVDILSEPGRGTTIDIYLPILQDPAPTNRESESGETPRGTGESVLVVDDDPAQGQVIADILNQLGYVAHRVESGEAAVSHVSSHPQDVILLDMIMDGIDGAETLRQVRTTYPEQRAIILSGFASTDRVEIARKDGVVMFLPKPIRIPVLARAVHRALKK